MDRRKNVDVFLRRDTNCCMTESKLQIPPELENQLLDAVRGWSGSRPFVIGIGGPSGVGKSTLAHGIRGLLEHADHRVLIIGVDGFFKDPRDRDRLGEWGPDHVRFSELRRVLNHIVAGDRSPLETMQYRRLPEKALYPWTIVLDDISVVVLEGLYAVSSDPGLGSLLDVVDLPVFIEAADEDRRRWRFEQEAAKPVSKSAAHMEKHWAEGIIPDTRDNVIPSRVNAAILLHADSEHQFQIAPGA